MAQFDIIDIVDEIANHVDDASALVCTCITLYTWSQTSKSYASMRRLLAVPGEFHHKIAVAGTIEQLSMRLHKCPTTQLCAKRMSNFAKEVVAADNLQIARRVIFPDADIFNIYRSPDRPRRPNMAMMHILSHARDSLEMYLSKMDCVEMAVISVCVGNLANAFAHAIAYIKPFTAYLCTVLGYKPIDIPETVYSLSPGDKLVCYSTTLCRSSIGIFRYISSECIQNFHDVIAGKYRAAEQDVEYNTRSVWM